jgi:hypothetical protein
MFCRMVMEIIIMRFLLLLTEVCLRINAALDGRHLAAAGRVPTWETSSWLADGEWKMRKIMWPVAWLAIAVWSGFAWLVYSLVDWGGQIASSNADAVTTHPETVEWLSWLATFGSGVGEWLVIGVWAVGTLLVLAIGFAGSRLFPKLAGVNEKLRPQR